MILYYKNGKGHHNIRSSKKNNQAAAPVFVVAQLFSYFTSFLKVSPVSHEGTMMSAGSNLMFHLMPLTLTCQGGQQKKYPKVGLGPKVYVVKIHGLRVFVYMGVNPKIGGKPTTMDGENHGKPYLKCVIWG